MSQNSDSLIGRASEIKRIQACLNARKNILLEGPVGVGKTYLVQTLLKDRKSRVIRIDGDSRFSEQKLTGWFDPQEVLAKGYNEETFIPGPLIEAMQTGAILFINELNRLPEGVQNVLLPAIDERLVHVPRLGTIEAHPDFSVMATQNPGEFVATSHLSEAILDRFEWIRLDYQNAAEEVDIVRIQTNVDPKVAEAAVAVVRLSRNFPGIRRGASIRAANSLAALANAMVRAGEDFENAILEAAKMALPTRIEKDSAKEVQPGSDQTPMTTERLIEELVRQALGLGEKKSP